MSFSFLLGALTLAPAVAALILLGIARFSPLSTRAALAVAAVGAIVPAVLLLVVLPNLAYGTPLQTSLFWGLSGAQPIWFAPALRLESYGVLAAYALAFIAAPLLLWMVWRTRFGADDEALAVVGAAEDDPRDTTDADPDTDETDETDELDLSSEREGIRRGFDSRLVGLALVLGIESAGLMVCVADNILWLGLMWTVLAALVWGIGEVGTAGGAYDRRGLIAMLIGPILWTGAMIFIAGPLHAARIYDLMGTSDINVLKIIAVCLTLALASGAYPFSVWVRRRAAFTPPAGLAATLMIGIPAAIFLAGRTFSALTDTSSAWPQIGASTPPVTIGIAFAIIGGFTVGITGVLALGRRDSRSLLALLATAQVGWAFLALGVGTPTSIVALTLLLASSFLGLSAMVVALQAGDVITADIEPESAGPRAEGAPQRPLLLFAWAIGGLSLLGVPLLAGFSARQAITASALHDVRLAIPLLALAWGGDLLLLVAFARATVPAFGITFGAPNADLAEVSAPALATMTLAASTADDSDEIDDADEDGDEDEEMEALDAAPAREPFIADTTDLIPAVLAMIAVLLGIVPQAFLVWTGLPAAATLLQPGLARAGLTPQPLGYALNGGAWLPTAAWIALALFVLVIVALRYGTRRVALPSALAGQEPEALAALAGEEALAPLAEPVEVWSEFKSAFSSGFAVPAFPLLLAGVEDESSAGMAEDEDEVEADDAERAAITANMVDDVDDDDDEIADDADDEESADAVPVPSGGTDADISDLSDASESSAQSATPTEIDADASEPVAETPTADAPAAETKPTEGVTPRGTVPRNTSGRGRNNSTKKGRA